MNSQKKKAGLQLAGAFTSLTAMLAVSITCFGLAANMANTSNKNRKIQITESFNTASMNDTDCVYVGPNRQRQVSFHATDSGEVKNVWKIVANAAGIGELTKHELIYNAHLPEYRIANANLVGDSCIDLKEHQEESGVHDVAVKLRSLTMENGEASYIKVERVPKP